MRWFKHYTDNHRGRSILFLFDQYGHKGLSYYILLELCAEKLEKSKDEIVTESDCVFYFHERILTQNLRLNRTTLKKFLRSCEEMKLFSCDFSSKEIKISMPILLNLLEKNFKKRTKKGLSEDLNSPLDIDVDKDKDVDVVKSAPPPIVLDRLKFEYSPEKQKFVNVLNEINLDKKFRLKMPEIMEYFETADNLKSFIERVEKSKSVQEHLDNEDQEAAKDYIAICIKKETGIIK